MVAAYRCEDRHEGRRQMQRLIDCLASGVPAALVELRHLGRTVKKRSVDLLAYFDRRHQQRSDRGDGRCKHVRGSALGFRNPTNCIARCLLEANGFRLLLHRQL
jgi:transposase